MPDSLAERIEAFKDRISPSQLFQDAITKRISELEEQDKASSEIELIRSFASSYMAKNEPRYLTAAKHAASVYFKTESGTEKLLRFYSDMAAVVEEPNGAKGQLYDLGKEFFCEEDLPSSAEEDFIRELSRIVVERLENALSEDELAKLV